MTLLKRMYHASMNREIYKLPTALAYAQCAYASCAGDSHLSRSDLFCRIGAKTMIDSGNCAGTN